jgi:hypothetical protein
MPPFTIRVTAYEWLALLRHRGSDTRERGADNSGTRDQRETNEPFGPALHHLIS